MPPYGQAAGIFAGDVPDPHAYSRTSGFAATNEKDGGKNGSDRGSCGDAGDRDGGCHRGAGSLRQGGRRDVILKGSDRSDEEGGLRRRIRASCSTSRTATPMPASNFWRRRARTTRPTYSGPPPRTPSRC